MHKKINLERAIDSYYGDHRSGWKYALNCLKDLHNDQGILVDGFIEYKFSLQAEQGSEPYREPWIGFTHNPLNIPQWWNDHSLEKMFAMKMWKDSLSCCKGLFCLSEYQKKYLEQKLDLPIVNLIHPTETPELKFSLDNFSANPDPKVVQVGWYLRKLHSICYLPVKKIKKAMLYVNEHYVNEKFEAEKKEFSLKPDYSSLEIIQRLSNQEYDRLLSENIVYMELYDNTANNAIIECIVRNTPVLVNPLPAVVEYLGTDYPFYFESRREAANKAENLDLIAATHNYLKLSPIKEKLTAEYFLKSFVESEIYQKLHLAHKEKCQKLHHHYSKPLYCQKFWD